MHYYNKTVTVTEDHRHLEEFTFSQTIQTSEEETFVGANADIYVGGAVNWVYALTYSMNFNSECGIEIDTTLTMAESSYETQFAFSQSHILNDLVIGPLINSDSEFDDIQNALDWLALIESVQELKESAESVETISFDAGAAYESSSTIIGATINSNIHSVAMDTSIARQAGLSVANRTMGCREIIYSIIQASIISFPGAGWIAEAIIEILFDEDQQIDFVLDTVESLLGEIGVDLDLTEVCNDNSGINGQTVDIINETVIDTTIQTINYTSFGYVLTDDDIGDHFMVNVLNLDQAGFGPAFELVSGISSCPWENWSDTDSMPSTIPVDSPTLAITPSILTDIPPDDQASFTLLIGNESPIGADREYWLRIINATNPDGAEISVNGVFIEDHLSYFVEAGTQIEATMLVGRGPEQYKYEDIELQLVSPCEYENWGNGGVLQLADTVSFNIDFQEPCSESRISSPEDGWLITSADAGDTLWVTVDSFDPADSNLVSIDLQYRGAAGGDWITGSSIPAADLISNYEMLPWIISPDIVTDGEYELRSQAVCSGGKYPGISPVVSGFIDRSPPQVLGMPEPVDGVLGLDDQILINLDESVNCDLISPGMGDILLVNTELSDSLDFTFTCSGTTITIEPGIQNSLIENQTLRAVVNNLTDSFGNTRIEPIEWEFFVNRNPIEWTGGGIENTVLYVGEEFSTTRWLQNSGGSNRSWNIINVPPWLEVYPLDGTLTPGNQQEISISLTEQMGYGHYSQTLYASGTMGDEPLPVDIRILCQEPEWSVIPQEFQLSMNIIAILYTENELSDDVYDMVGVFVDDELRGFASVDYYPELDGLGDSHPYEVYLTVFSNSPYGEELRMEVWDASECRLLGQVDETFTFNVNTILGTTTAPVTITATDQIIREYEFLPGWNWFSLNLTNDDMSISNVLSSLSPNRGDLIKTLSGQFTQYSDSCWYGTLLTIENDDLYLVRIASQDTLEMMGRPVDLESTSIQIDDGWNWISYLPQQSYELNDALDSLSSHTGDLIKGQSSFAMFTQGLGWIGDLYYMNPGAGYKLYSLTEDSLRYHFYVGPVLGRVLSEVDAAEETTLSGSGWQVIPGEWENTMSCISQIQCPDTGWSQDELIIGAFCNGVCCGVAQPQTVQELDEIMFFLTIYGSSNGSDIVLKVYNEETGDEYELIDELVFEANAILGSVLTPLQWTVDLLGKDQNNIPTEFSLKQNYPNPFNGRTTIRYAVPQKEFVELAVYNLSGQKVSSLVLETQNAGFHEVQWNGCDDTGRPLPSGVYFCRFQAGEYLGNTKIVLLK